MFTVQYNAKLGPKKGVWTNGQFSHYLYVSAYIQACVESSLLIGLYDVRVVDGAGTVVWPS